MDSFMLMGLRKYKDFELKNVAQAEVDTTEKPKEGGEAEKIPDADFSTLVERFKQVLGERVTDVHASNRLSQSVARLVDPEGAINPELQRVYKYLGKEYETPKKILELNPSHSILKNLLELESGSDLQTAIIEQIYDSALLVEGLHPDPSSMASRVQQIIEAALSKSFK
jgi:molecular chaperone HtpG